MAGSLNHIVADDGTFKMGSIENMGDAHEALDECFKIIHALTNGDKELINRAGRLVGAVKIETNIKRGGEDEL